MYKVIFFLVINFFNVAIVAGQPKTFKRKAQRNLKESGLISMIASIVGPDFKPGRSQLSVDQTNQIATIVKILEGHHHDVYFGFENMIIAWAWLPFWLCLQDVQANEIMKLCIFKFFCISMTYTTYIVNKCVLNPPKYHAIVCLPAEQWKLVPNIYRVLNRDFVYNLDPLVLNNFYKLLRKEQKLLGGISNKR